MPGNLPSGGDGFDCFPLRLFPFSYQSLGDSKPRPFQLGLSGFESSFHPQLETCTESRVVEVLDSSDTRATKPSKARRLEASSKSLAYRIEVAKSWRRGR